MGRGRTWLLAAGLLIATPALAEPGAELNRTDLPPAERARIEAEQCGAEAPPADLIRRLALSQGATPEGRISGAKIAACHPDPTLVPVVWQAFLESKLDVAVHDPDIFERHLRTLQRMDPIRVQAELAGSDPAPIVELAWNSLLGSWLAPLAEQAGSAEAVRIRRDPEATAAAEDVVREWIAEFIGDPDGLVRLQTDSGDAAYELLDKVAATHVASLIRSGTVQEVRLAIELVRQRVPAGPEIRAAIEERVGRDPELAAAAADLPDLPAFQVRRGSAVYRVSGPVSVDPPARSFAVDPVPDASPEIVRLPLVPLLCALGLGSLALWLALLRLLPTRRPLLFRLAAVALAPAALLIVEGVLTVAGYHPLIAERPSFDPTRAPRQIAEEITVHGVGSSVRISDADARSALFPRTPTGPRVVTFGGSSVHGTHYLHEETFSAHLARTLDVEVINAGVGGVLSDQVTFLAFEALERWSPDVLVVYLGNNDLEHLGRQVSFKAFDTKNLYARYAVDRLRVARLLRAAIPASLLDRAADAGPDAATLDADLHDPAQRARIARLARWNATTNLIRVAERAHARDVEVLFVIQGQNEEACPPTPERITEDCFPQGIRQIAIDAAAATGSPIVDGAGALRWHAGGAWASATGEPAPAGYAYYWDQIHPTRLGHAVLGAAIAPEVDKLLR